MKFKAIKIKALLDMINSRSHTTKENLNELENRIVIKYRNKSHKI